MLLQKDDSSIPLSVLHFLNAFLQVPKVAVRSVVSDDDFRSPNCRLVFGQDAWVRHKDNGIWYHFDVTKCMFSFGNISEKIRISKLDCQNDVIVDLFAGIGYFTLQYLVHARAHKVVLAIDFSVNSESRLFLRVQAAVYIFSVVISRSILEKIL